MGADIFAEIESLARTYERPALRKLFAAFPAESILLTSTLENELKSNIQVSVVERQKRIYYGRRAYYVCLWKFDSSVGRPVCIENLIRFDCVAESHNVSANGRADILLAERGCLALQVEEPA
jgi:hypothetical protein